VAKWWLALAEGVHKELVEACEQRVAGGSSSMAMGLDGGAQPAMGHDGGAHSVPATSPTTSSNPPPGSANRLVPVPADLDDLAARQVAVPDLDEDCADTPRPACSAGKRQRGGVLPLTGGVVETGGPGREVHAASPRRTRRTGGNPPSAGCRRNNPYHGPPRAMSGITTMEAPDKGILFHPPCSARPLAISLACSW